MNNFATVARMLKVMQTTKNQAVRRWAEAEGKKALLAESILNPKA